MDVSRALRGLLDAITRRKPLGVEAPPSEWVRARAGSGEPLYRNRNPRLGIDFTVDRLAFAEAQVLDPRVVVIAPGQRNELHRHAHESLFVILEGEGEVQVGDAVLPVAVGDVAFVPRWIFHQTRNTSPSEPLRLLAITDFGLTSAVLGDYDRRTRQSLGGEDAPTKP